MRALLSVASRDGLSAFARGLQTLGVELFATDGTREHLAEDGIESRPVSELTGSEAFLGGQVKTFHPAIYGGILARRDMPEQLAEIEALGIAPIDIVAVNVRPFGAEVGKRAIAVDQAVEMIDVGGAALLSAAARNAAGVVVVSSPSDYARVLTEMRERGMVSAELRAKLAAEAFATIAAYHAEIAAYLNQLTSTTYPKRLAMVLEKVTDLRYGENPHQTGAFYRETTHRSGTLADASLIQGEEPTFNNLLDLDAAYRVATDFTTPTVCISKHTDPVGIASADDLVEAYRRAVETDPVASFGAIVAVNRTLDGPTAREIVNSSYEAVIAAGYDDSATATLAQKPGLEVLSVPKGATDGLSDYGIAKLDFKRVSGGLLLETVDDLGLDGRQLHVVTKRRPTLEELTDLLFAWRAVRHVRSNAIVLAKNAATVGIGSGQPNRLTSVEIAVHRAGARAKLSVMASDAYFPFPDAMQLAATAGITAIIQPGGSIRDEMAIELADRHHMAMVFTGRRHFRH